MKKSLNIVLAIGWLSISLFAYAGEITEPFTAGEILTAEDLENARAAVNDNNARINSNASNISNIGLTPSPTYSLGATGPAGGFVFYVTDDGLHGFEAAPVDQGRTEWGCFGVEVTGARGTRLGSGKINTHHIVTECESGTAADIVDAYSHNGYNDWYLPSKDALTLMETNLHLLGQGGFPNFGAYWSSSEFDINNAWVRIFNRDDNSYTSKGNTFRVRAVRAF